MTIANTNVQSVYNCNGSTRDWDLGFYYDSTLSSFSIYVEHADGTSEEVTTNYELDGDVLTYPTVESELDPLPVGDKIIITRITPLTQSINLVQQGPLDAEVLESGFDKLTMEVQEVKKVTTDNIENINIVANNISDINTVASDISNIDAVVSNSTNINSVASNLTDINTVASISTAVSNVASNETAVLNVSDNLANVNTIASNMNSVLATAADISNINTVAGDKTNIDAVAGNKTNIDTVASNMSDITTVSSDIVNINAVAYNKTNIDSVAGNSTNINAVASNISNINAVNNNKTNIDAVADNETNINAVAGNKTNIDTIAGISSDVTAVATNNSDISTVATNISDVGTVATNISNVNTAATNMSAIIAAPTQAANAATSASNAQKWAEGADSDVTPLGGEHSAKGWSNVAKQYAESIGAALKYKGSVSTYSNLPSTGQEIGDMWNVLDTGKNYAWTGTEWDDLAGVVDLSAYRTAAAQDVIDSGKQDTITGAATSITSSNLTASKALVSDANGKVAVSSVTATELGYVSGVTSSIQTQIGNKQDTISDLSDIRSGASAGATAVQSVSTGSTNGTISVDGTDVSVKGLGSAAYTASTAYATSSQGAKADTAVQPSDLATVATSGSYTDLLNQPTIPTVNDATLTIQKNGTNVATFTANSSTNATANITVPTQASDIGAQETLVSGTNIKTINSTSLLGSGDISIPSLPSQTGNNGKFLTTDGSSASWATVNALPSQTGQNGKFLTTDGTDASWADISVPNNVYTEDNLVAGTNISLDQVQISGGIDENTLVLLHFDGNNTDSSPYSATTNYTNMSNMSYADSGTSFGQYLTSAGNADSARTTNNSLTFPTGWDGSCTIDFRVLMPPSGTNTYKCNGAYIFSGAFVLGFAIHYNGTTIYLGSKYDEYIDITSSVSSYLSAGWNHIAVTYDGTLHVVKLYINGVLRYTRSETINFTSYPPVGVKLANSDQSSGDNGNGISEVRVSSIVRYTEDFSVPTKPYSSSTTTITAINNTQAAVSADGTTIENNSNVLTAIGVKDQKTNNTDKFWSGTRTEYDAIVSKDNNTFYHITDDLEANAADTSLSNLTNAGKIVGAGLGLPSSTYEDLTLGATGTAYTAPANGWFALRADGNASTTGGIMSNIANGLGDSFTTGSSGSAWLFLSCPALKGQQILIDYSSLTTIYWFRFVYAEGSKSEA